MLETNSLRGFARREYGLRLLSGGMTSASVAQVLGVRPSTVSRWIMNQDQQMARHRRRRTLNSEAIREILEFIEDFTPTTLRPKLIEWEPTLLDRVQCEQLASQLIVNYWSTEMVRLLIRIRFPLSRESHLDLLDIEKWLRKHGMQYRSGWRPRDHIDGLFSSIDLEPWAEAIPDLANMDRFVIGRISKV